MIVHTNEIWWWIISDDINYTVRDEIVSGKEYKNNNNKTNNDNRQE